MKTETGAQALDRALAFFSLVIEDGGKSSIASLAQQEGLPLSTAHRLMAAFERQRLITRTARGHYLAGMRLAERVPTPRQLLIQASRPLLHRLATSQKRITHLGVLEAEMVTYLVKEAGGARALFTREMMQLEAYCTGIGKVLLAGLGTSLLDRYLDNGPFVRMTPTTITEPADLRAEVAVVAAQGHAFDRAEMAEGLYCVAVPIRNAEGRTVAAISMSTSAEEGGDAALPGLLPPLIQTARELEHRLFGERGEAGGETPA